MASSISDPQLLINEGELDEILRIIDNKKKPQSKIVGNLFGLWRNSLIQPVVQLITGPGAGAKTSKETFKPDVDYQKRIKKYLQNKHGLLQIGLWFYGNVNRYPRFDQGNRDFNGDNLLIPRKGNHVVLMFVDDTRGNLEIEYQIINTSRPESPRVAHLTAQDVLPGASGFRLLKPVFDKINRWAKFPYREDQQTRCFSTNMLQSSTSTTSKYHTNNATPVTSTNATAIPSPMVRPSSQWYESDGGSNLLRRLVDDFKSKSVSVEISRDSRSHDITLELDRGICLHFPADFPTGLMSLTWSNDTSTFTRNPNEICRTISDRASNVLSGETVRRMSRTTRL